MYWQGFSKYWGSSVKASAIAAPGSGLHVFSALTCIPIYFVASRHFGEDAAAWAGWAWALFPYAIFFSAEFIWATSHSHSLFISVIFLWALHLEHFFLHFGSGRALVRSVASEA